MPSECNVTASEDTDLKPVMQRVGAQVLETMFFAEAVPMECNHCWAPAQVARVTFSGSHAGEFLFGISEEAIAEVASAFLGLDPEESSDRDCGQVILELSNILCGSMLSAAWPESNLLLSAPEICAPGYELAGGAHQCFAMPAGMLFVSVGLTSRNEV